MDEEPSGPFLLALSGLQGTGKSVVAQVLQQKYGWDILPFSLQATIPSQLDSPKIVEGKFAGIALHGKSSVPLVSLLFITKKEIRYERIIRQQKARNSQLTRKQIIETIKQTDEQEKKEFETQFPELQGQDPFHIQTKSPNGMPYYDWFINSSHKTTAQLVGEIEKVIKRKLGRGQVSTEGITPTLLESRIKDETTMAKKIPAKGTIFRANK